MKREDCEDSLGNVLSSSVTLSAFVCFAVIRAVHTFKAFPVIHDARELGSFAAGGFPRRGACEGFGLLRGGNLVSGHDGAGGRGSFNGERAGALDWTLATWSLLQVRFGSFMSREPLIFLPATLHLIKHLLSHVFSIRDSVSRSLL